MPTGWRTGSGDSDGDGERYLSTRRKCLETEVKDKREVSHERSEEEGVSLNVLSRMREGNSSSLSSTTTWLASPDKS